MPALDVFQEAFNFMNEGNAPYAKVYMREWFGAVRFVVVLNIV